MTEERQHIGKEQIVGGEQCLPHSCCPVGIKLILILPDCTPEPVAVVMEHDSHDGDATHRGTFIFCQYACLHFFLFCSLSPLHALLSERRNQLYL